MVIKYRLNALEIGIHTDITIHNCHNYLYTLRVTTDHEWIN
jgi:hypothetical protein